MLLRTLFVSGFLLLTAAHALAGDGFVVESQDANMPVGAALGDGTALSIGANGHLVILTDAGQMLRRNGPFSGTLGDILGGSASDAQAGGRQASAVDALIDLARDKGTAENRTFATRGSAGRLGATGPFSITVDTRVYCHRADVTPAFTLENPPARDIALTLDRISPPASSHASYWPAGEPRLAWPADWPGPRAGDYLWSAGYARGEFRVKVYSGRADPGDALGVAAELKRQGCADQAWAALKRAARHARVVN